MPKPQAPKVGTAVRNKTVSIEHSIRFHQIVLASDNLVVGKINFTATDNRHIQLGLKLVW
jgi:hypothetical protein